MNSSNASATNSVRPPPDAKKGEMIDGVDVKMLECRYGETSETRCDKTRQQKISEDQIKS